MEPVYRMVTFESAGSGAGRRGGDRAVNVSQRVGGIKRDKKIQSGLIMRLIQARMRFCVKLRFQTIWRTIEAHLRSCKSVAPENALVSANFSCYARLT